MVAIDSSHNRSSIAGKPFNTKILIQLAGVFKGHFLKHLFFLARMGLWFEYSRCGRQIAISYPVTGFMDDR